MARIGVFGGTFNPIHIGHKSLVDQIKKKKYLNKVLIIPTNKPPHKPSQSLAENQYRLEMCKLVFKPEEGYIVSDLEFKLGGNSYTIRTLECLKKQYPDDDLFLIIGSDMLYTFEFWKEYKKILEISTILAGARNEDEYNSMKNKAEWLSKQGGDVEVVPINVIPVSSTDIRDNSKKSSQYLDVKVAEYIEQHCLYNNHFFDLDTAREVIREHLNDKRYHHSICVANEAVGLAKHYGADVYKAELAGILHDVMKNKEDNYLLQYFYSNGIILTNIEKKSPKLWHSIAGAAFVQHELKIDDMDIINSIRYHTTAREGMSLLEKIIYVADCNSEDRDYKGVKESRKLSYQSLDKTILYNLRHSIRNLAKKQRYLHPDSIQAYNSLLD